MAKEFRYDMSFQAQISAPSSQSSSSGDVSGYSFCNTVARVITNGDTSIAMPDVPVCSRSAEMITQESGAQVQRQNRARASRYGGLQVGRRGAAGADNHKSYPTTSKICGKKCPSIILGNNVVSLKSGIARKSNSCTVQCEKLRLNYSYERPRRSSYEVTSMFEELLKNFDSHGDLETRAATFSDQNLSLLVSEAFSDDEDEPSSLSENLLFRIFAGCGQYPQPRPQGVHQDCLNTNGALTSNTKEDLMASTNNSGQISGNLIVRPRQPSPPDDSLDNSNSEITIMPSTSINMVPSNMSNGKNILKPRIVGHSPTGNLPEAKNGKIFKKCEENNREESTKNGNLREIKQEKIPFVPNSSSDAVSSKDAQNAPSVCNKKSYIPKSKGIKFETPIIHVYHPYATINHSGFFESICNKSKKIPPIQKRNMNIDQKRSREDKVESPHAPPCLVKSTTKLKCDTRIPHPTDIVEAINRAIAKGELSAEEQQTTDDSNNMETGTETHSKSISANLKHLAMASETKLFPSRSSRFPIIEDEKSNSLRPLGFFKVSANSERCIVRHFSETHFNKLEQRKPSLLQSADDTVCNHTPLCEKERSARRGPLYKRQSCSYAKDSELERKHSAKKSDSVSYALSTPPNSPTRSKAGITFSDPVATCVTDRNTNKTGNTETSSTLNNSHNSQSAESKSNTLQAKPIENQSHGVKCGDGCVVSLETGAEGDRLRKSKENTENKCIAEESTDSLCFTKEGIGKLPQKFPQKTTLTSHPSVLLKPQEYLDFYSFLKSKKPVTKEVRQPKTKIFKLQRMMTDISGGGGNIRPIQSPEEPEVESKPIFPRGREVPPGWMPGQHGSHPITRISAEYEMAAQKPAKPRKYVWKRTRTPKKHQRVKENNQAPKKSASESSIVMSDIKKNKRKPQSEQLHMSNDPRVSSSSEFERKRRFYERQQRHKTRQEGGGRSGKRNKSKKVTEQVKFLKTIDDICNAAEDEDDDGEVRKAMSDHWSPTFQDKDERLTSILANYYNKKVGLDGPRSETVLDNNPASFGGLRINRANVHVPSAMSHERLRAIQPPSPERVQNHVQGLPRRAHHFYPNLPLSSAKWPEWMPDPSSNQASKKYIKKLKSRPTWASPNRIGVYSDYKEARDQLRASYIEIENVVPQTGAGHRNGRMTSETAKKGSLEGEKKGQSKSASQKKTSATKVLAGIKEKSSKYTLKQVSKLPPPPNRSEEDTWCYSVNAMLLKAKQAMADNQSQKKGTHRFPRHNSAAVVSPVIETKATSNFLKTLLRQDAEELRQSKALNGAVQKQQRDKIQNVLAKTAGRKTISPVRATNNSCRVESLSPKSVKGSSSNRLQDEENLPTQEMLERTVAPPVPGSSPISQQRLSSFRISKPVDLSSRKNTDRFQKCNPKDQNSNQRSYGSDCRSYILDHALHYFDYPYISDNSIVPLFGNSNTNALSGSKSTTDVGTSNSFRLDNLLSEVDNSESNVKNVTDARPQYHIIPSPNGGQPEAVPDKGDTNAVNTPNSLRPKINVPKGKSRHYLSSNNNAIQHALKPAPMKELFAFRRITNKNPMANLYTSSANEIVNTHPDIGIGCLDKMSFVQCLFSLEHGFGSAKKSSVRGKTARKIDLISTEKEAEAAYMLFLEQKKLIEDQQKNTETLDLYEEKASGLVERIDNSPNHESFKMSNVSSNAIIDVSSLDPRSCNKARDCAVFRPGQKLFPARKNARRQALRHRCYPLRLQYRTIPDVPLVVLGLRTNFERTKNKSKFHSRKFHPCLYESLARSIYFHRKAEGKEEKLTESQREDLPKAAETSSHETDKDYLNQAQGSFSNELKGGDIDEVSNSKQCSERINDFPAGKIIQCKDEKCAELDGGDTKPLASRENCKERDTPENIKEQLQLQTVCSRRRGVTSENSSEKSTEQNYTIEISESLFQSLNIRYSRKIQKDSLATRHTHHQTDSLSRSDWKLTNDQQRPPKYDSVDTYTSDYHNKGYLKKAYNSDYAEKSQNFACDFNVINRSNHALVETYFRGNPRVGFRNMKKYRHFYGMTRVHKNCKIENGSREDHGGYNSNRVIRPNIDSNTFGQNQYKNAANTIPLINIPDKLQKEEVSKNSAGFTTQNDAEYLRISRCDLNNTDRDEIEKFQTENVNYVGPEQTVEQIKDNDQESICSGTTSTTSLSLPISPGKADSMVLLPDNFEYFGEQDMNKNVICQNQACSTSDVTYRTNEKKQRSSGNDLTAQPHLEISLASLLRPCSGNSLQEDPKLKDSCRENVCVSYPDPYENSEKNEEVLKSKTFSPHPPCGNSSLACKEEAASNALHCDLGSLNVSHSERELDSCGPPPPSPYSTHSGYVFNREYLQPSKLEPMVSIAAKRRGKLLRRLETIVKARCYMPAFHMKDLALSQTLPLVFKINYCSVNWNKRYEKDKTCGYPDRNQAPVTVLYTQNDVGYPISLYALRLVERGLYSIVDRDSMAVLDHLGCPKLGILVEHQSGAGSRPPGCKQYPLLLLGEPVSTRCEAMRKVSIARYAAWESGRVSTLMQKCMGTIPWWMKAKHYLTSSKEFKNARRIFSGVMGETELSDQEITLQNMLTNLEHKHINSFIRAFQKLEANQNLEDKSAIKFSERRYVETENCLQRAPFHTVEGRKMKYHELKPLAAKHALETSLALSVSKLSKERTEKQFNALPNIINAKCTVDTWRCKNMQVGEREDKMSKSGMLLDRKQWWPKHSEESPDARKISSLGIVGSKTRLMDRFNFASLRSETHSNLKRAKTAVEEITKKEVQIERPKTAKSAERTIKDEVMPYKPVARGDDQLQGWEWPQPPVLPPPFPDGLKRTRRVHRMRTKQKIQRPFKRGVSVSRGRRVVLKHQSRRRRSISSSLKSYSSGPSVSSSSSSEEEAPQTSALKKDMQKQPSVNLEKILGGTLSKLPHSVRKFIEAKIQRQQEEEALDLMVGQKQCKGDGDMFAPFPPKPTTYSPLTTPSACSGDAEDVSLMMEYDMLSDADEAKEIWAKCFPPVRYSNKKKRWCKTKQLERSRIYAKQALSKGLGSLL
ncbi:complement component c3 [Plakobranchus ocellatus]|uniref:Complement component c3 n=1 Tax=Plakobranchus ocellatus TaxID=259542 RepID=A0AAV3ZCC1_9GAST|nr:complement component c3 [Plakobranchus ocellatus]